MTNKKTKKYDANFTAGGLLHHEFISLKEIILSDNFLELIKVEEEENKLMAVATKSSRKRIISEIKRRYHKAPTNFWPHFFNWNISEQKLGLFYLCLKTYPLIFDIHLEVTIPKSKTSKLLEAYDIQMRFDEIASVDADVENWSSKTLDKLNSQYRTALKEIELLSKKQLKPTRIENTIFWDYFTEMNEQWFKQACFL